MPRPPLPLGSYGKIKSWKDGNGWLARAKFRDFDGIVRPVKQSGGTKTAAENELHKALAERQAPARASETKFSKVADLWFAQFERAVDEGRRSPAGLDTYRSIYRRHVQAAIGALRVREVDTRVVDRALAVIKKRSMSSARTSKIVISGVMKYAARQGAVLVNPTREVERIDGPPRRRPRSLTAEERQQWIAAVKANEKARSWGPA